MILAADEAGGIGFKNGLPWPHISDDMLHFKNITKDNVVVMGSNTWNSLGRIAPLKDRINYVVSTKGIENFPGCFDVYDHNRYSIEQIIEAIDFRHPGRDTIIIGGKTLYDDAYSVCDVVYLTRVMDKYKCDTYVDTDVYLKGKTRKYERLVGGNQHTPTCYIERWETDKK
jgi:dihydrofolate reductase